MILSPLGWSEDLRSRPTIRPYMGFSNLISLFLLWTSTQEPRVVLGGSVCLNLRYLVSPLALTRGTDMRRVRRFHTGVGRFGVANSTGAPRP